MPQRQLLIFGIANDEAKGDNTEIVQMRHGAKIVHVTTLVVSHVNSQSTPKSGLVITAHDGNHRQRISPKFFSLLLSLSKSNRASHDLHLEFRNSGVLPALYPSVRLWRWIIFFLLHGKRSSLIGSLPPVCVFFIEGDGG